MRPSCRMLYFSNVVPCKASAANANSNLDVQRCYYVMARAGSRRRAEAMTAVHALRLRGIFSKKKCPAMQRALACVQREKPVEREMVAGTREREIKRNQCLLCLLHQPHRSAAAAAVVTVAAIVYNRKTPHACMAHTAGSRENCVSRSH